MRGRSDGSFLFASKSSNKEICYLSVVAMSNQVHLSLALTEKKSTCFDSFLREKNPVPLIACKNQLWLSRTLSRPDKTFRPVVLINNNTAVILKHLTSV